MILQVGNHQELAATQPPRNEGLLKFHRAEAKKKCIAIYCEVLHATFLAYYIHIPSEGTGAPNNVANLRTPDNPTLTEMAAFFSPLRCFFAYQKAPKKGKQRT